MHIDTAPNRRRSALLRTAAATLLVLLCLTACKPRLPAAEQKPLPSSDGSGESIVPSAPGDTQTDPPETDPPEPVEDESWKLILVNADHPLPEGFTVNLKDLRNGQQVDERIYPELQQMFDDAREAGIYPYINESFRTAERQQQILDKYIANYMSSGLSREEAERKAREVVALPGTSEHQLGLALDLIGEYGNNEATWAWLRENSWRYGFILRYPAGKEEITGYAYEAWHFRYVGVPTAQEITEAGLCLEEYLALQGG